ncbi:JAB domain-containing protein [Alteromonadaceae bacterium M269]|nr:JAB domain-containing protein [Alteromonadaceae bacterium M269]
MKIMDWPQQERPREKLLSKGPEQLSDAELLAIFLRTGLPGISAVDLARGLLNEFGDLRELLSSDVSRFCQGKGLGIAKFVQLQATLEMARRYYQLQLERTNAFSNVNQTVRFLMSRLRDEDREVFALLLLDSQHQLIEYKALFYGSIDSAVVYPREIVKLVLDKQAAAVILAHNHPSGVAEPSIADKQITQRIKSALELIDVTVLDHLIIGDGQSVSFAQRGLI